MVGTTLGNGASPCQWLKISQRLAILGIVSGQGSLLQGVSQDGHYVDKLVFWSERRLSKVGVGELDSVRELLALGVLPDD